MILYHPLSGFLTLFANILHNPRGRHAASDLHLMNLVTEFLAPLVTDASPFTLSASIRLLRELENVATRLVDRTTSSAMHLITAVAAVAPAPHPTMQLTPSYTNLEIQDQTVSTQLSIIL